MRRRRPLARQKVQAGAWTEIARSTAKALPCETAQVGGEAGLVPTPRAVLIAEAISSGQQLDLQWERDLTLRDQPMKATARNRGEVRRDARTALDHEASQETPRPTARR